MGKILLFNVNIFKYNQIKSVCDKLGHSLILVKKEQYGNKIGEIAGIIPGKMMMNTNTDIDDEMMVFVGLDSDSLDIFLAEYKKASVSPILRKAIMTPANINWTVKELFEDLDEHVKNGREKN